MSGDDQKSFFDTRTMVAVALMIVIWMGWENYMRRKYPPAPKPATETAEQQPVEAAPAQVTAEKQTSAAAAAAAPQGETVMPFQSPEISFELSSRGMGLKNITLNKYKDRNDRPVRIGASSGVLPLQTNLRGQAEPVLFNIEKISDNEFKGTAQSPGATIVKTIKIDSANYVISTTTDVNGQAAGVTEFLSEESRPTGEAEGRLLGDPVDTWLWFFAQTRGEKEHTNVETGKSSTVESPEVSVAALGSRYFAQGIADNSSVIPSFKMTNDVSRNLTFGALEYPMLPGATQLRAENKFFVGPKNVDILRAADPRLEGAIDLGFFSWLAYPILDVLNWFYKLLHNYGWAIIALTIAVRMIVLPLNIMSYRSMKAMQVIQPQITRLKEKYKDDRESLNREMMILMRDNKVNPLGGCLPMLLQLPVFLALYAVLNATVELYRAPWILWIHDLSLKDPYYVLPVLMGIVMYIQQKMTPTTMDPAQAKVMQFMPVIFTFMMVSLPSGLTLYIFVSTLFGIIQQLVFMRDKKTAADKQAAAAAFEQ